MRGPGVLVLGVAVVGCGRVSFDPLRGAPDAPVDGTACTFGTFGPPVNLAVVNSSSTEWAADLSFDGLTLYFASDRAGGQGGLDIYQATRPDLASPFANVTNVVELNTAGNELGPAITSDGLTMYLAVDGTSRDIFVATRATTSSAFGAPVKSTVLSSPSTDDAPAITRDGKLLVLRSDRAGSLGASDVFLATFDTANGAFTTPVDAGAVNSTSVDEGTTVSADGLTVMFGSTRTGGPGGMDVYMSARASTADPFPPATLVPELSSSSNDDDLSLSGDGTTVVFSSDRPGGLGSQDIWMATRSCE